MKQITSQTIWRGFHWSFFINTQGLIICLRRFERFVAMNRICQAEVELKTATDLMTASSASLILAGSFSRQEYDQVRTSMSPPHVKSSDFSGLMSWEHAVLVQVWKRLRPIFAELPAALKPQHEEFVHAYHNLANAHRAVCEKFGGDKDGSLRFQGNSALDTLDKFGHSRQQLINPQLSRSGCPFH